MADLTVTAVLPHWRDVARMERQMAALAAQSRPFDEIIVVDDASPPEDVAALSAMLAGYPRARLLRRAQNAGPAIATNDGLAEVRTDCVAFLASDDVVTADFVAVTAAQLEAHPAAAFCFADPAFSDPSGRVTEFPLYLATAPHAFTPESLRRRLEASYFTFATNTILYRTGPMRAAGGMPIRLSSFADSFVNFALGLRHGAVYVPRVLGVFCNDPGSFSHRERADPAALAGLTRAMLLALEGEFADVAPEFRAVGVLPKHDVRMLRLLLSSPEGRRYVTPRMAARCLAIGAWHGISGRVPASFRRFVRRIASRAGAG
ncbi:glycosyltransferase family 2 protein [Sediminicoccus sp. KRV36]|uniref:glycosyltransferase family 2 protein n=1 Tax=Sediminicoccus sp. KRV36 TaxID=3133721 RepID=UPI0020103FEC|nr:glycosyltransferase family 2 protein [Sediminicoccus rosea]UPY38182.1 glycosyltransferase [Sediminicoccus rosea]